MTRKQAIIAGLASVAGLVLLVVAGYAVQWFTAEPRGALDARERTVADGEFRLAAYDHFFDLCSAVQAQEDRLLNLRAEYEQAPSQLRSEQLQASMTAVQNERSELIREYNADASRDYTVGQFRDSDLPFQLDTTSEETRCTTSD